MAIFGNRGRRALAAALIMVSAAGGCSKTPENHPAAESHSLIAYMVVSSDGRGSINVIGSDGNGIRRLTKPSAINAGFPAFSPDGTTIAFLELHPDHLAAIWVMGSDGSDISRLSQPRRIAVGSLAFSPDGREIAFAAFPSDAGNPNDQAIYLMDVDGSGERELISFQAGDGIRPSFSPDGARVAFSMDVSGHGDYGNFTVGTDGTNVSPLGNGTSGEPGQPTYSPDGKRIAFVAADAAGRKELHTMTPDGANDRKVTDLLQVDTVLPSFSPDGTQMAFTDFVVIDGKPSNEVDRYPGAHKLFGGLMAIYVVDSDGGQRRQLTNPDLSADEPPSSIAPAWG